MVVVVAHVPEVVKIHVQEVLSNICLEEVHEFGMKILLEI